MTVVCYYVMHAGENKAGALEIALTTLAGIVRPIAGCEGVQLLRDLGNDRRFVFVEKWLSVEAHKASGAHVPKEAFAPIMGLVESPPDSGYLDYLVKA